MPRRLVLLSEGSSLSAREFVTVLGLAGIDVEIASSTTRPLAGFSRWCRTVRRVPPAGTKPVAYLQAVDRLMASGRYSALLATHEQSWLFAAGRDLLPHTIGRLAIADVDAFDRVQSKIAFARLCDELGVPQPDWNEVLEDSDLDRLGYPVWVKAAWSTAGRGVRYAHNHAEAVAARSELDSPLMVQAPASGVYRQVAALFDHGRLFAAVCSEQAGTGAGGSAAARVSVSDPEAVAEVVRIGRELSWHGG